MDREARISQASNLLERVSGRAGSTRESIEKLLGLTPPDVEKVVEEYFSIKAVNQRSITSDISKLRQELEDGRPEEFSSNEAALLLFSYISNLMVEKKSEYERLSRHSNKKQRQEAEGRLTEISYLLDICVEIRNRFNIENGAINPRMLLPQNTENAVALAEDGETEKQREEIFRREMKRMKETHEMLRRFVNQQSSVN